MAYHPIIIFRSKEKAKTPIDVIFGKHYEATFPQIYKTEAGATKFARRNLVEDCLDDVWQLPGAKRT